MARVTKRDIYKQFDVNYIATNGGQIYSPIGWIKPLLKEGNEKTGKKCFTFSMLAGTEGTCVCDCPDCYAKTGCFNIPSVKESNVRNQHLVENYLDFVKRAIMAQIKADHLTMVRIHASGDFNTANSEQYAAIWVDIIRDNPTVKFWTYTKMSRYETMFDSLPNANIVPSVLPYNIGLNYGTCSELLRMYDLMKKHNLIPHICKCGIDENQHCENCAGCSDNKYVLFVKHSAPDYDSKKDPLLPKIAEIIDGQGA